MANTTASPILRFIRRVIDDHQEQQLSDQELLQRFHDQQDQAAFHALFRRHGSIVLDVRRSILPNEADIEDAFQATFLILASKSGSIYKTASLGSWLHGVAFRVAHKVRAQFITRQKYETRLPIREDSQLDDLSW